MDKYQNKYQNKYRISSARLQNWDYGNNGAYFITICTHQRQHFFGKIMNGEMQLNEIGKIVESEWIKTPELRPDMNLEMGVFVVMPNHFHGIIIIGHDRDAMHRVSTEYKNTFAPQSKNMASIIRGFKSSVTTKAKKMGITDFAWQPRFHDHIIRNTTSFTKIQHYIENNPLNWEKDKFI